MIKAFLYSRCPLRLYLDGVPERGCVFCELVRLLAS